MLKRASIPIEHLHSLKYPSPLDADTTFVGGIDANQLLTDTSCYDNGFLKKKCVDVQNSSDFQISDKMYCVSFQSIPAGMDLKEKFSYIWKDGQGPIT